MSSLNHLSHQSNVSKTKKTGNSNTEKVMVKPQDIIFGTTVNKKNVVVTTDIPKNTKLSGRPQGASGYSKRHSISLTGKPLTKTDIPFSRSVGSNVSLSHETHISTEKKPIPGFEKAETQMSQAIGVDNALLKVPQNQSKDIYLKLPQEETKQYLFFPQQEKEDDIFGNNSKVPKKKSITKKLLAKDNRNHHEFSEEDMPHNITRPDGRVSPSENFKCRIQEELEGKNSETDTYGINHTNDGCIHHKLKESRVAIHSDKQKSARTGESLDANYIDSVSNKEKSIGVLPHNNSFGSDSGAKPKDIKAATNNVPNKYDISSKTDPTYGVHAETYNDSFHIDIGATNDSIISLNVDVIVSSDDPTLRSGGLVAQVIAKQGGGLLEECKQCIRQMCPHISTWTLQPTPAVGKLKNKHVFHAVVKPFSQQNQSEWIDGLQSLITEIIFRAEHMGYESLAIPLLGTGKNGAPTDLVIGLLCATIEEYAGKPRPIFCLKSVTIVHPSKKIKDEIKKALKVRTNCSTKQKPTNKEKTSNNSNPKEIFLKVDSKLKEKCPICLEEIKGSDLRQLSRCSHLFCKKCITESFKRTPTCPLCNMVYGEMTGTQPQGLMVEAFLRDVKLPSYDECGTICIMYLFEGGIQTKEHPNPGRQYKGTKRTAYLPDNADGQKVHRLLRKAFSQRLVFTIGASRTTGKEDVVTWNDIHHKTSIHGSTAKFGYPDPDYLSRVLDELAAKGITED